MPGSHQRPTISGAGRVGEVDDDQDMIDEAVEQRRAVRVAPADPPQPVDAETLDLRKPIARGLAGSDVS